MTNNALTVENLNKIYSNSKTKKETKAIQKLCNYKSKVSSHYFIKNSGEVLNLVPDIFEAWHAGKSSWQGTYDINSRSIGIELDNAGTHPFSFLQMRSLVHLCKDIQQRWSIGPHAVLGHSDIALGRKADPGRRFDWEGLARFGVGVWPRTVPRRAVSERDFLKAASHIGYDVSGGLSSVLDAVRLRFAPSRTGPLSAADCALIDALEQAFVIDPSAKTA